ncbi:MAG: efflux RND transporter periplasmic adaptor subunit [Pseudomonadales bacterium]
MSVEREGLGHPHGRGSGAGAGDGADDGKQSRAARGAFGCLIPLLLIAAALLVGAVLYLTRDEPQPVPVDERVLTIRSEVVRRAEHRLDVSARGRVMASRRAVILPQVGGRIVELGPNLVPGSLVSRGELLARIDPEDYRLAVRQVQSRLAEAEAELALERGRQQVAEEEWRMYRETDIDPAGGDEAPPQRSALALREPQQQVIAARVRAARADLAQARLELQRTEVRAPFDALVLRERAALGQLSGPQHEIAELAASSHARVQAAVRLDQVDAIAIPGVNAEHGSRVRVFQDLGNGEAVWHGRVQRLLGDVQPEGLMAQLLIVVDDPFRARADAAAGGPLRLLIGASVGVEIDGRHRESLVAVPRQALREDDRVYVVGDDDRLSVRRPEIVWRLPRALLVRSGVADGERVIVSPVEAAVDGMRVREEAGP